MKRNLINSAIMVCLVTLIFASSESFFNSLSTLKSKTNVQPIIITRPGGGYIAIWQEKELVDVEPRNIYEYRSYYKVMDSVGNTVIPKHELMFWRDYNGYTYDSKSILFLNRDSLLVIARKVTYMSSNPVVYHLEKLIIDLTQNIVIRDSNDVSFQNCSLARDTEGNVYAIELGHSWQHYVEIIRVEPSFGKPKKLIEMYPQKHNMKHYLSSEDNVVTMTAHNDFLVVGRVLSVDGRPVNESPDGWQGLPNRLACFLVDPAGNIKIKSYEIELTEVAFRKIIGIHVGGIYGLKPYKGARNGLDFTHLPNGNIILSVTGLDKKEEFCMYQVCFDSTGRLQKSETIEEVEPKSLLKDLTLPVFKVEPVVIGLGYIPARNKTTIRREYILFGFDEEGNFYEKREIWKEGEE